MIRLEDVSSYEVLGVGNNIGVLSDDFKKLPEFKNIKTVADLEKLFSLYPHTNEEKILGYIITEVNKSLNRVNKREKEVSTYDYYEYSSDLLRETDKLNLTNVLMLDSPSSICYSHRILKNLTIEELKTNLKLCNRYGKNMIESFPGFGETFMKVIIKSLDLYSKQIEENAKLTDRRDINLLLLDYDEKRELVESYYETIIDYFMHVDKTIWGNITDRQKQKLFASISCELKVCMETRERMSEFMTYYLTLEDLNDIKNGNVLSLSKFRC